MLCGVADGGDYDAAVSDEIGEIAGKAGKVHSSVSAGAFSPEQGLADEGFAGTLDFQSEAKAETGKAFLVKSGGVLSIEKRFREKLQDDAHRSGAIFLRLANAADEGTEDVFPASKLAIRSAISASHAASESSRGAGSMLSRRRQAKAAR